MKKILKWSLIFLLSVIALVLIIAAILPKELHLERKVEINSAKAETFEYLKYLKNQDNFSVWNRTDPTMKKFYKGTDGTVGFIYGWDSKNEHVGTGEQEITKIEVGKRIDLELRFKKPFVDTNLIYLTCRSISEKKTEVVWGFDGYMEWPMNFFILVMNMEKTLGDQLQEGLDNLKIELEKK